MSNKGDQRQWAARLGGLLCAGRGKNRVEGIKVRDSDFGAQEGQGCSAVTVTFAGLIFDSEGWRRRDSLQMTWMLLYISI
jgi:hypothetical protein